MKRTFLAIWTRAIKGLDSHAFVRLIQTHVLSAAGDGFMTVALAGSVFFNEDPNTARSRVAFSLILTVAPFAIVAPFLGPAIDKARGGRRLVLLSASAARAFLCLLMASSLESVALYPIAFLALVCSKAHAVAKSASVPELVKSDQALVRANSILAVGAVIAGFLSAAIGFVIGHLAGPQWVLRGGALIFACSAALALEIGATPPASERNERELEQIEEAEGLPRGVVNAGVVMATLRASVGFLAFLIAFDLRRRGAATWWFGVAITGALAGSSIGNLIVPRLRGKIREERILIGFTVIFCIASIVVAQRSGRLSGATLALVLGICAAAAKISFDSLVQRDAPAAVQGRSFARFEAVFQLVWVIGALIPVAIDISTDAGFWMLAFASGAVSVWYVLTSIRRQVDSR